MQQCDCTKADGAREQLDEKQKQGTVKMILGDKIKALQELHICIHVVQCHNNFQVYLVTTRI